MRLIAAIFALIALTTGADAREGVADLRWSEPATEDSAVLLMVRNAEGDAILSVRESVEAGATQIGIEVPPLTRQASTVQAGLVVDGRVIAQSLRKTVSARDTDLRLELRSLLAVGFDDHWICEDAGQSVRLNRSEDAVHLRNAGPSLMLARDAEKSDLYTGPDGSRILFHGNTAGITLAGQELGLCHPKLFAPIVPLQIMALDGAWSVELGLERATLILPGLDDETVAATGLHVRSARDGEIRITAPSLTITLRDERCVTQDGVVPYPFTAALKLDPDAQATPGCAGNPLDLLAGAPWQVQSIYGQPLSEKTPMLTLQVSGSEISGRTPCNRYVGTATVIEGRLAFSELGATRLACPAEQRNVELRFLDALEIATGFDLWRNGGLSLRAGSVAVLTATRK